MKQDFRLEYLTEKFKEDFGNYASVQIPPDREARRVMLRSLMNIRVPGEMDEDTLRIQDEYLQERAREKGIVTLEQIPAAADALHSSHRHAAKLSVWQGDITRLAVGAIVNAANSQMLGCFVPMHSCIDNCIHSFAGVQLRNECNRYMTAMRKKYGKGYEEPTGHAVLTSAYNLPADYCIHTVGPIVNGALTERHREDLASCYRSVMECCRENGIRSVAFCCISTGVFRFPNEEAARIAVETVSEFMDKNQDCFDRVIFNVFKDFDREIYEELLS